MENPASNSINLPVGTLGQRILYCRKSAKLSQKELAKLTGVTQGAVVYWEIRGSQPHIDILRQLSRLFSVNLEWLLEGNSDTPEVQSVQKSTPKDAAASNTKGLSPLQIATLNALEQGLRRRLISDAKCISLLGEIQTLIDSN